MRFLKKKLAKTFYKPTEPQKEAQQASSPSYSISQPFIIIRNKIEKQPKKAPAKRSKTSETTLSKNIVKNYGKAMSAFSASKLSWPYLVDLAKEQDIEPNSFLGFISTYKESIDSIDSLRAFLIVYEDDEPEMVAYKTIFRGLCEIFLKYFAVNWVFHGKMMHKIDHLKYRHKMLRRVKNPEYFTYLTTKLHKWARQKRSEGANYHRMARTEEVQIDWKLFFGPSYCFKIKKQTNIFLSIFRDARFFFIVPTLKVTNKQMQSEILKPF